MIVVRLEQLYHLVEVAQTRSISLAAERFYVSQPAISSSISKLEEELGVMLFKRTSQGAIPTEIGETIIQKAWEILDRIEEIKHVASASSVSLSGSISVSSIPGMCDAILPNALSLLNKKHPDVNVLLKMDESVNILSDVQTGRSDIGIVILTEEIQGKDVNSEELLSDEFVIYAGKNSPLSGKDSVSIKEVLSQPFAAYNDEFIKNNGGISSILRKFGDPKVTFRFSSVETIKRAVAEGTVIAFFPKFMAKGDIYLQSGRILSLPINDAHLSISIGLIWSKRHRFSSSEKKFIEILKMSLRESL